MPQKRLVLKSGEFNMCSKMQLVCKNPKAELIFSEWPHSVQKAT